VRGAVVTVWPEGNGLVLVQIWYRLIGSSRHPNNYVLSTESRSNPSSGVHPPGTVRLEAGKSVPQQVWWSSWRAAYSDGLTRQMRKRKNRMLLIYKQKLKDLKTVDGQLS